MVVDNLFFYYRFNNISPISSRSIIVIGETRAPRGNPWTPHMLILDFGHLAQAELLHEGLTDLNLALVGAIA